MHATEKDGTGFKEDIHLLHIWRTAKNGFWNNFRKPWNDFIGTVWFYTMMYVNKRFEETIIDNTKKA